MISQIAFWVSLVSASLILVLSSASAAISRFQFWPPPGKDAWQHKTFMILFRGYLYPLIALTALRFDLLEGPQAVAQYSVGITLFVIGFGLAFRITFGMGWRNAFGEKRGLRTTGLFARSRNPIYVVTWIGLIGWGLVASSLQVTILLAVWALLYLLAPFLEEPWLEEQYGEDYRRYKETTPRFF